MDQIHWEYNFVEKPFREQLYKMGWEWIDRYPYPPLFLFLEPR
jgi:hypothetical protein